MSPVLLLTGILAGCVLIYLFIALLMPEKFE